VGIIAKHFVKSKPLLSKKTPKWLTLGRFYCYQSTLISSKNTSLPPSSRERRPPLPSFINSTLSSKGNGSSPVRSQWTNRSNCFLNM